MAKSVGAYVVPDAQYQILRIKSKYPYMPWEWATSTPDVILPHSVVTTDGLQWDEHPLYNATFVSGTSMGVTGHVIVTGSAGDIQAKGYNHDLITTVEAAREAGRSVLGMRGRSGRVTLSMPFLDTIGLIEPGLLVKYVEGGVATWGICRSVSIEANGDDTTMTLELEIHA